MEDASKQQTAAAMTHEASANDLVLTFTSNMSSHWQVFQSSLVLEFARCISLLQEENQALRNQVLSRSVVEDFDGRSVSHPCRRSGLNLASDTSYKKNVVDIDEPGHLPSKLVADCVNRTPCRRSGSNPASDTSYEQLVVDIDEPGPLPSKRIADAVHRIGDDSQGSGDSGAAGDNILIDNSAVADAALVAPAQRPSSIHKNLHLLKHSHTPKKSQARRAPPIDDHHYHLMHTAFHHGVFPPAHPDHGWVQKLVFNKHFEFLSAVIILLNTLTMALHLQYAGLEAGYVLEWRTYSEPAAQSWPWMKDFKFAASIFFNVLFCVELVLRVAAAGKGFCCQAWIWFDTIVVSLSMMDLVLPSGSIPVNPGMMRVMRLARMVRLLKLLKTMTVFDSLFLLIKAITASIHAAIWSFLILVSVQIIVGLFLCQILLEYINDTSNPLESREQVFIYFGGFSRSMLTMFEITLGNWVVCCRMLLEHVNEWFMLFFLAYRCFFCFAVLKVISAVFITETNRVLEHDDELTVMKKNRDKDIVKRKVQSLIQNLDLNHSGMIDWDTFDYLAKDEDLARLLVALGFDIHDLEKLFWLLQDGHGYVQTEEFLHKVGRLRGNAKSIDSQTLIKVAHRIDETVHTIFHNQGFVSEEGVCEKSVEDKALVL